VILVLVGGIALFAMIGVGLLLLGVFQLSGGQDGVEMPAPPDDSLFVGTYHLGTGVNDPNGPSQYVLELRADGSATSTTYPSDPNAPVHVLNGRWTVDDAGRAVLSLTERDGAALDEPIRIVFVYRDLFLVAVEHPFGDDEYEFTLGPATSTRRYASCTSCWVPCPGLTTRIRGRAAPSTTRKHGRR
jgi:hypothetical protein